jgi:hypothetical protein
VPACCSCLLQVDVGFDLSKEELGAVKVMVTIKKRELQ